MLDDDNKRNNKIFKITHFYKFIFIFFFLLKEKDFLQKIYFHYHLVEYRLFFVLDNRYLEHILLK
jgi:hypothetical protein